MSKFLRVTAAIGIFAISSPALAGYPYNYGLSGPGDAHLCTSGHAGFYKPDYSCATWAGGQIIDTALWRCQYNDQGYWSPLWGWSYRCDR